MNTAAVAALEARVKLYMKNYEGAITAAQEAITLSGGTIVSTKEDYKNMYTTLAVSTEDIFFIAKAEDDYFILGSDPCHRISGRNKNCPAPPGTGLLGYYFGAYLPL